MTVRRPRVGIPVSCTLLHGRRFQTVGEKYLAAIAGGSRATPVLLPAPVVGDARACEALPSADDQLANLDGLFLTGSASNMEPTCYGSSAAGVGPFDPQRDANDLALLAAAAVRNMPVLGVCRGLQELNVACGGTLHTSVHQVPGLADHREDDDAPLDQQYGPAHEVFLSTGGWLAELLHCSTLTVNSLHDQGIDRLGDALAAEAHSPDGLIEAVRHRKLDFVIGVQWHPEWRYHDNPASTRLFEAFGRAAAAYHAKRAAARTAPPS